MNNRNSATVYVVQNDSRKDFSDAQRYGQLRDVFGNVGYKYNTARMLAHARRVLRHWQEGDHLLIVGDPTLCGVAMLVIAEQHGVVDVLRWDRVDYKYVPQRWDLYSLGGFEPEEGEDDSPIHNAESEN